MDGQRLYHLDAYRLSGPAEAEDLDLDEMLESGVLVVEWCDRIQAALPAEYLQVKLTYIGEYQRDLLVSGTGPRYQKVLSTLRKGIYGG
jgi:tRNA threonylcarbamoyl adenosine modification protein YjeE